MPGVPRRSSSYSFSTPLFPMLLFGWYGLAMRLRFVGALLGVELVLRDAPDVAEHVRGRGAVVVVAHRLALDLTPGKSSARSAR